MGCYVKHIWRMLNIFCQSDAQAIALKTTEGKTSRRYFWIANRALGVFYLIIQRSLYFLHRA